MVVVVVVVVVVASKKINMNQLERIRSEICLLYGKMVLKPPPTIAATYNVMGVNLVESNSNSSSSYSIFEATTTATDKNNEQTRF